jgi:hypothetical protein
MHGDAFTQLCDLVPQDLTVSHEATIESQATTFEVTADSASLIGIAMNGIVLGTAEGTGSPVMVDIDPPGHPGIMYVAVTKLNYRRYESPVIVQTGGPLDIWLPQGAPDECLPGPPTEVFVMIFDGTEAYVSGSGTLHYRFDPSDPFDSTPMTELSENMLSATVPGAPPMSLPEFYFSAQGDLGSTVYDPPGAPDSAYTMVVHGLPEIVVLDDFERDNGWTVENTNLQTGAWIRDVPSGNSGSRGDPPTDSDGSGKCYVTGNAFDEDVDGGPTVLFSPDFDLSSGDAVISFDRWYYNDDGDDPFIISVSSDGGYSWTVVDEQTGGSGGWSLFSFNVEDYVAPSDQTRVRCSAQDEPNDSVTEGGVDNFMVSRVIYDVSLWADAYSFSATQGCEISFYLDAGPTYAGYPYVVVGGLSGSYPGTPLPGGLQLPVNRDWLTDFILDNLNSALFVNFQGNLDGDGKATATLVVPGTDNNNSAIPTPGLLEPPYVGETGTFAFILTDNWDLVSNALFIDIEP